MHAFNYLILQLIQLIWELESRILVLHLSLGWKRMTSCPYLSNHNLFDPIVIGGWKQTTSCLNFPNDNPIQWTPIIPPPFNSCFRMFLWHWDYPITSVLEAHVCVWGTTMWTTMQKYHNMDCRIAELKDGTNFTMIWSFAGRAKWKLDTIKDRALLTLLKENMASRSECSIVDTIWEKNGWLWQWKSYHDAKRARVTRSEYCIVESTMLTLLENRIVQGIFCTI